MLGSRWNDRSWILLWAIVSSIWCLTAAPRLSATFDEPHYLKQGLHAWRTGSLHMLLRGGTMPLPINVQLLPAFVWEQVRDRPIDLMTEFDTVLQMARAVNLVFWWLLLYFSWRLASRFGGVWAGRLTVPLIACDPNFLAHASLATTDIAVTAWTVMFTELYLGSRQGTWRLRVAVPGVCFGIGLLAKASALPFGVIIMGVIELYRTWQNTKDREPGRHRLAFWFRSLWTETRALRRDFWQIFGIGIGVAMLYCGSDWRIDPGFVAWASKLPPGLLRDGLIYFAEHLAIFPNAGVGLVYQIQHNMRGHGAYVVGEWHQRAIWYYFPLALTMKLTLPVLILLVSTLAARPKSYAHSLGLLVAVLFLFTLNCRVQIGIRLILPLISLLLISLSVALVQTWPNTWPVRFRPVGMAGVCLLVAIPMLRIWPHGLCYFNLLWGGPEGGYRYLSDSNFDWGQGMADLRRWQEEKGGAPLKIWYFGLDPRMTDRADLANLALLKVENEKDLQALVKGHYLAVGATMLYSNPALTPSGERAVEILRQLKPVARTMTYFIYDFTEPTALVAVP